MATSNINTAPVRARNCDGRVIACWYPALHMHAIPRVFARKPRPSPCALQMNARWLMDAQTGRGDRGRNRREKEVKVGKFEDEIKVERRKQENTLTSILKKKRGGIRKKGKQTYQQCDILKKIFTDHQHYKSVNKARS